MAAREATIEHDLSKKVPAISARRFKVYPECKDSGVDWLGKIPDHWEIARLKRAIEGCFNGTWGSEPDGENDFVCIRVADFDRTSLRVDLTNPTLRSVKGNGEGTRFLKCGNLLIEKSGGGDNQSVGTVVLYDHEERAVGTTKPTFKYTAETSRELH